MEVGPRIPSKRRQAQRGEVPCAELTAGGGNARTGRSCAPQGRNSAPAAKGPVLPNPPPPSCALSLVLTQGSGPRSRATAPVSLTGELLQGVPGSPPRGTSLCTHLNSGALGEAGRGRRVGPQAGGSVPVWNLAGKCLLSPEPILLTLPALPGAEGGRARPHVHSRRWSGQAAPSSVGWKVRKMSGPWAVGWWALPSCAPAPGPAQLRLCSCSCVCVQKCVRVYMTCVSIVCVCE